jgi:DedD protein
MYKNERGGIISNLIIIPAAVTLMVGFFFLGYYVGRYQSKPGAPEENVPPLPEVVSKNLPKPEDYTFYKTLTGKDDKTVSIELRPKALDAEMKPEKRPTAEGPKDNASQPAKTKGADAKTDKRASQQVVAKPNAVKSVAAPEKKAAPLKQEASSKLHYTIQLSSHQEKSAAEDEVKKMKQSGYAAFIVSSELPGKGMWYRVRLGSFSNKAAAEKLQKEIREKAGGSPIITIE